MERLAIMDDSEEDPEGKTPLALASATVSEIGNGETRIIKKCSQALLL